MASELKTRAAAWLEARERAPDRASARSSASTDEVAAIEGLTPAMLVALGEKGVKTLDDLADLAADELTDEKDGILKGFELSLEDANAIIMAARAHWFEDEAKTRSEGANAALLQAMTAHGRTMLEAGDRTARRWPRPTAAALHRHAPGAGEAGDDPLRARPGRRRSCRTSTEQLPGRGLWVTAEPRGPGPGRCARTPFAKAAKQSVKVAAGPRRPGRPSWPSAAVADLLGLARKSGQLVAGFEKVEAALRAGPRQGPGR